MTCAAVIHEDIQLFISQFDCKLSISVCLQYIYIYIYIFIFFVAKYGENETENWMPGRTLGPISEITVSTLLEHAPVYCR